MTEKKKNKPKTQTTYSAAALLQKLLNFLYLIYSTRHNSVSCLSESSRMTLEKRKPHFLFCLREWRGNVCLPHPWVGSGLLVLAGHRQHPGPLEFSLYVSGKE